MNYVQASGFAARARDIVFGPAEADISTDVRDLAKVRAFVRRLCRDLPFEPVAAEIESELELAAVEAVVGMGRDAFENGRAGRLHLEGVIRGGCVVLTVSESSHRSREVDSAASVRLMRRI